MGASGIRGCRQGGDVGSASGSEFSVRGNGENEAEEEE